jgi:hypothetical protein
MKRKPHLDRRVLASEQTFRTSVIQRAMRCTPTGSTAGDGSPFHLLRCRFYSTIHQRISCSSTPRTASISVTNAPRSVSNVRMTASASATCRNASRPAVVARRAAGKWPPRRLARARPVRPRAPRCCDCHLKNTNLTRAAITSTIRATRVKPAAPIPTCRPT